MQDGDSVFFKGIGCISKKDRVNLCSLTLLTGLFGVLAYVFYLQVHLHIQLSSSVLNYDTNPKIGIISDLHLDLSQNSTSCTSWNYTVEHYPTDYGARGCDTSYDFARLTLGSFASHLQELSKTDFILNLGDFVNHYTSNNIPGTVTTLDNITHMLVDASFHSSIYSTLGNNDMAEDYLQPYNSSEFYGHIWEDFLSMMNISEADVTSFDAKETFTNGGYYTVVHMKSVQIISLNTVSFSSKSNVSQSSCMQQLNWFEDILSRSALPVIVIGHVNPGFSFFQMSLKHRSRTMLWKEEYIKEFNRIMAQYSNIIKFTMFSHHHAESWFAKTDDKDHSINYFILPSISPIYEGYPAYAVAIVNTQWDLLDLWHYYCPLDYYIHKSIKPRYLFQYSFKEKYMGWSMDDKDMPVDGDVLSRITESLNDPMNMQYSFQQLSLLSYQFRYAAKMLTPYHMYCAMTCNTVDEISGCLAEFKITDFFNDTIISD